jgi:hypothetical protein
MREEWRETCHHGLVPTGEDGERVVPGAYVTAENRAVDGVEVEPPRRPHALWIRRRQNIHSKRCKNRCHT